ncbi:hypothetical protein BURPS1710b_A2280 [Burkholderia pseudomallei 1710b]|uniref:Uncharacterized protein n=1 Tax=Burkholderia pseudomallei (strain 1710b) TaxID=320372 RepID=Q3JG72_BURP1|nr:hypothetical protein BURPS1710b_A2280 [Burkholderia pseudomallei 1710b]
MQVPAGMPAHVLEGGMLAWCAAGWSAEQGECGRPRRASIAAAACTGARATRPKRCR